MMLFHRHKPEPSGFRVVAVFPGKNNVPEERPVYSTGEAAYCHKCGARLIVHDRRIGFPVPFTEIDGLERAS